MNTLAIVLKIASIILSIIYIVFIVATWLFKVDLQTELDQK